MPTSTPTMARVIMWGLKASRGLEMVSLLLESRLRMQTNFCFSTAPIMMARPLGSVARYSPGTIRRTPVLPNVSWWIFTNRLTSVSNSRITMRPESEPTTTKSFCMPMRRNGTMLRMSPKTSYRYTSSNLPVSSSTFSSSRILPFATTSSSLSA